MNSAQTLKNGYVFRLDNRRMFFTNKSVQKDEKLSKVCFVFIGVLSAFMQSLCTLPVHVFTFVKTRDNSSRMTV